MTWHFKMTCPQNVKTIFTRFPSSDSAKEPSRMGNGSKPFYRAAEKYSFLWMVRRVSRASQNITSTTNQVFFNKKTVKHRQSFQTVFSSTSDCKGGKRCDTKAGVVWGGQTCVGWPWPPPGFAIGYIIWEPSMTVLNFMTIHHVVVKTVKSGPKRWTDWLTSLSPELEWLKMTQLVRHHIDKYASFYQFKQRE